VDCSGFTFFDTADPTKYVKPVLEICMLLTLFTAEMSRMTCIPLSWDWISLTVTVRYLNASDAFSRGLAWVADNGTVYMKADDTTNLAYGEYRDR
jgi:hypothetical protein